MDAFTEIGVFVRVVDARGFTRAARGLGLTASGVSRIVSRLEERLGVRLLRRTTRSISLTGDGQAYYDRCKKILRDLEDADVAATRGARAPHGRLRVDMPTTLARFVSGELPRFLERYPDLSLDLSARDHIIDPIAEGVDVVVRMADLRETDLVSKKLGVMRFVLAASPAYLAKHGRPTSPADLARHRALGFLVGGATVPWRFRGAEDDTLFQVTGRLHTNSGDALRRAALAGLGLVCAFETNVADDLASGALEVVMRDHELPARSIYALYERQKYALPKVRAFLDFMKAELARR